MTRKSPPNLVLGNQKLKKEKMQCRLMTKTKFRRHMYLRSHDLKAIDSHSQLLED